MTEPEGSFETRPQLSSSPAPPPKKTSFLRRPVKPIMILAIILGVIVLRGFLIEGVIVDGDSMNPTLHDGERVLVKKQRYSADALPARGEIVIFPDPEAGQIVVKRVIGLPGEELAIFGTKVFVNRELLLEPYAKGQQPILLAVTVPEDSIWVMGDNRDDSTDSRDYGPIELSSVRGRALFLMWPLPPRGIPKAESLLSEEEE